MIEIRNLTKKFDDVVAVDNLSLNLESGIYGLVGQNGAGKSTLFRCISDVYETDSGEIYIDGNVSTSEEAKKLIFFLSDDPYFERNDNMDDMLNFYDNFYDIDKTKFYKLVKHFELPKNVKLRGYSKGMKRQTFLSLALSIKCKYLFLDEAFDGLDPLVLEVVKEELLKLKDEGKVIVASSHNINTLEKLVDSFIMVTKGRLSGNDSNEHIGENFIKYQVLFKENVGEEMFHTIGLKIVSVKKYGSIFNFVVLEDKDIEKKMSLIGTPVLLERVPIDIDEIVKLKMIIARKEYDNENNSIY